MEDLENYTVQVNCGNNKGTAFFISPTILLTARHIVIEHPTEDIIISKYISSEQDIIGNKIAECPVTDVCIIEIPENNASHHILNVCKSEIIKNVAWQSYGYPETFDGNLVGEPLEGSIIRYVNNSNQTTHDVSITYNTGKSFKTYAGFSGSPLVDDTGDVFAIMRFENTSYLSAVSIKKACLFLIQNNIQVRPDKLANFNRYADKAFKTFEETIKLYCESFIKKFESLSPDLIINTLKGAVYYPEDMQPIEVIVSQLRLDENKNAELWKGWIRFLAFITIMNGNFTDLQNIIIKLTGIEAKDILGNDSTLKNVSLDVKTNFIFTEEEQFFRIAQKYILNKSYADEQLSDTCQIFNSSEALFGIKEFTAKDKRDIVPDIADPMLSGLSVPGKINFGVMSLLQLTNIVGKSSPETVFFNLEKYFKDAIAEKP